MLKVRIRQFRFLLALPLMLLAMPRSAAQAVHSLQDDALIRQLLSEAKTEQVGRAKTFGAFHDFAFTDRLPTSGITFVHHMTEDSGRAEKPVHYDHGSGIAAADVDGDGRIDLFFANQIGGNQLWRNLGGGRFEDITARAGIGLTNRVSVAAAFADLDNDGDPDLVVSTVREGNALFENLGGGRFREVSAAAGWNSRWHSSGIVLFDFNRDGRTDVFITSVGRYTSDERGRDGRWTGLTNAFAGHLFPERNEPEQLYRNDGGWKFTEVAADVGLAQAGWSGDATACDINEDGWPDLYVVNMQGDDHLFVNVDGTRFEDRTAQYFPKTPWGAMGVAVFDHDLDGHQDFFVTDMHSDMTSPQRRLRRRFNEGVELAKSEAWCSATWNDAFLQGASNNIFGNAFYRSVGAGQFKEASDALGLETFWPWGISVGDVNADGYEDLFVTAGMGYPFAYAINSLLLNEAGTRFDAAEFVLGLEPRREGRVSKPCFTLDCDGADRTHTLCAGRKGQLTVQASLSSRSAVFLDLDDDGDLDLVTNEFDDVPQVLISDLANRGKARFLKVKLIGGTSNRDGLGAVVTVRAGGKTLRRFVNGKSGYLGQSSLPLYFGLGEAEKPDEVRVVWPGGATQNFTTGLSGNETLVIREATVGK